MFQLHKYFDLFGKFLCLCIWLVRLCCVSFFLSFPPMPFLYSCICVFPTTYRGQHHLYLPPPLHRSRSGFWTFCTFYIMKILQQLVAILVLLHMTSTARSENTECDVKSCYKMPVNVSWHAVLFIQMLYKNQINIVYLHVESCFCDSFWITSGVDVTINSPTSEVLCLRFYTVTVIE